MFKVHFKYSLRIGACGGGHQLRWQIPQSHHHNDNCSYHQPGDDTLFEYHACPYPCPKWVDRSEDGKGMHHSRVNGMYTQIIHFVTHVSWILRDKIICRKLFSQVGQALGWSSRKYLSLSFDLSHQSEQCDWLRIWLKSKLRLKNFRELWPWFTGSLLIRVLKAGITFSIARWQCSYFM